MDGTAVQDKKGSENVGSATAMVQSRHVHTPSQSGRCCTRQPPSPANASTARSTQWTRQQHAECKEEPPRAIATEGTDGSIRSSSPAAAAASCASRRSISARLFSMCMVKRAAPRLCMPRL